MNSPPNAMNVRDRLIVALDFPTPSEALALVSSLGPGVSCYKIGLQLYTAAGPEIVRAVADTGARIFLDLKLHDIPNTVGKAVTAASRLGVEMLTIHLSGGRQMVDAAIAARSSHLLILGVTVLTSSTAETLVETGISSGVEAHVIRLAELGKNAGIDGVITSPHEVRVLRARLGPQIKIVTPGVRPLWSTPHDQKRFTTPSEALQNGADYLVIGRPITEAPEPRVAYARILEELEN